MNNGNVNNALDYLFSHPDEVIVEEEKVNEEKNEEIKEINVGNGSIYDLYGYITHLGKSADHGHYVCHIRQDKNNWKYFNDYKTSSLSVTFNDSFTKQLRQAWNDMVNNIKSALQSKKMSTDSVPNTIATGGIIGSNGVLHRIAQYAGGTLDAFKHGSVFVAGENGPEVMGHINGKTEILNRSQIASTMFQAVTNGMRQFKNAQMVQPPC